jgi:putative nucleotidyltransferase with HDIG domain
MKIDWNLLLIHPPGNAPLPGGILLLDVAADKLYVRVRRDLVDLEEDTLEVLSLLAEDLELTASEVGGAKALSRFEEDWSHAFRLSGRQSVELDDPIQAVQQIFEERVVQPKALPSEKKVTASPIPVFTRKSLVLARESLPLSPVVTIQALAALRDPNFSLKDIQAIVSKDPTIAAHLIRLANSALHSRGQEVRSVSESLMKVGADRARLHLSALAVRKAFSSPELRAVWNHSIEVVQIVRELCGRTRFAKQEEAMLIALVHDIGQLALSAFGAPFRELFSSRSREGQFPVQIERELCGVSHAEIGADLLEDWLFPADMVDSVRNHHEPSRSGTGLGFIIHLAECMSNNKEDVYALSDHASALKCLDITESQLLAVNRQPDSDLQTLCFAATN